MISVRRTMVAAAATFVLSLASVAVTAGPASAHHVYQPTFVLPGIVQSDMKPIAGTDANNTGLAKPYDPLDANCLAYDSRGVPWILVINRAGRAGEQHANTVGFIRHSDQGFQGFYLCPYRASGVVAFTTIRSGIVQSDMKPIAGTDANNTGLARPGDVLAVFCSLKDNRFIRWDLVMNMNGRAGQQQAGTVGFVRWSDTANDYPFHTC